MKNNSLFAIVILVVSTVNALGSGGQQITNSRVCSLRLLADDRVIPQYEFRIDHHVMIRLPRQHYQYLLGIKNEMVQSGRCVDGDIVNEELN